MAAVIFRGTQRGSNEVNKSLLQALHLFCLLIHHYWDCILLVAPMVTAPTTFVVEHHHERANSLLGSKGCCDFQFLGVSQSIISFVLQT